MKPAEQIPSILNALLKLELRNHETYLLFARTLRDMRYPKLAEDFAKESAEEQEHAERLIDRMLMLEVSPDMSHTVDSHTTDIEQMFQMSRGLEADARDAYGDAIQDAEEVGDYVTRDALVELQYANENHLRKMEVLLKQIETLGLPNFLQAQL